MKVAYLLTWSGDDKTGVFKKVADQAAAWNEIGVEVGLFLATTRESELAWRQLPQTRHVEVFGNGLKAAWIQRPLMRKLQAWKPDITYVRTTPRQFVISGELRKLPHVIEIQTDDMTEARGLSIPRYVVNRFTRHPCLQGALGMVFTSRELSERASYRQFTNNRIVIANGIDLSRIELLAPVRDLRRPLRFAFMGLPGSPWHGLDQVIALARIRPEWSFDLIGPSSVDRTWPLNVRAHGELKSGEYRRILAQADAAVSTLAWFRSGMQEGSPLKSREYLALGLPVIGSYIDTDLPNGSDFYLRIPNRNGATVDCVNEIEEFTRSWKGRRVNRSDIQVLDQLGKEQRRLAFFRELLESIA